jgi:hypothetical protein
MCSKKVVVILLNGQKVDVICDPNTATAGQVFEVCMFVGFIRVKRYWYHWMQNKEFSSAGLMHFKSLSDCVLEISASKKLVGISQCNLFQYYVPCIFYYFVL